MLLYSFFSVLKLKCMRINKWNILKNLKISKFQNLAIFDQCGGLTWNGPTRCVCNAPCQYESDYYSQCQPVTPQPNEVAQYGQCGGQNYNGLTKCVCGFSCVIQSQYYSQCKPLTSSQINQVDTTTESGKTYCFSNHSFADRFCNNPTKCI